MPDFHVEIGSRPCPRGEDECLGMQYPEDDGECRWWACVLCGYESGHELSGQADAGACSAGVPVGAQVTQQPGSTFLGEIGRRPA